MKQALAEEAGRMGLTQYEIYCERDEEISVETLKDEISAFASGVSGGICFRCIVDGKMGYASGELMTVDAMKDLVRRAVSNAACIDSTDEVFLYGGSDHYETPTAPEAKLTDPAALRKLALGLQQATYAQSEKVGDGTQSYALSSVREVSISNSNGLDLSNRIGISGGFVSAVVRDGEEAQTSSAAGTGDSAEALKDLPAKAVRDALDKLGAGTVPSGKYDVVFSGEQFRNFLSAFSPVFSAKQAQLGLSLLAGKEGTPVASPSVSLIDDPLREGSPMQTAFDGEGVATARRAVVENGILKTLLYDLTTAKKAGVRSTGNGQKSGYASPVSIEPYQFSLAPGNNTREDLFRAVGNGIFITDCKGFHAGSNSVTGDFSIESEGFLIRDGKRNAPIRSFTVAGNFFDLLRSVDQIGDTVEWSFSGGLTSFGSPDVLIRQLSIAGM